MREHDILDKTSLPMMTPEEFSAYAIVVGVEVNADPASPRKLSVPPSEAAQLDLLRAEISRIAHKLKAGIGEKGRAELESRFLMGLMSLDLQDDATCNRLEGGRPVVLARSDVIETYGRSAVAQHAHRCEIEDALDRNDPVHTSARDYYFGSGRATAGQAAMA